MQSVLFDHAPWEKKHKLMYKGDYVQAASFYKHVPFSTTTLSKWMRNHFIKDDRRNYIHIDDLCNVMRKHDLMDARAIADLQGLKRTSVCEQILAAIKNLF